MLDQRASRTGRERATGAHVRIKSAARCMHDHRVCVRSHARRNLRLIRTPVGDLRCRVRADLSSSFSVGFDRVCEVLVKGAAMAAASTGHASLEEQVVQRWESDRAITTERAQQVQIGNVRCLNVDLS